MHTEMLFCTHIHTHPQKASQRQRCLWQVSGTSDVVLISFICATKTNLWGSDVPAVCTTGRLLQGFISQELWYTALPQGYLAASGVTVAWPCRFGGLNGERCCEKVSESSDQSVTAKRDSDGAMTEAAAAASPAPVICWWIKRFISWLA